MENYIVGNFYNFWVTSIGGQRIFLKDSDGNNYSVEAYDFQKEWDWSSPKVPIPVLSCYVRAIAGDGTPVLLQNRSFLLQALYPDAAKNEKSSSLFVIDSPCTINGTFFFVLADVYGLKHLYKPSDEERKLQPGDEIQLCVNGIKEKANNKTHLLLSNGVIDPVTSNAQNDDSEVGPYGEETDKVEFKSTLVYPAGATSADIDTQMKVIVKTIAGFLNSKGGTLYIGVNDNGFPIGIENEYHLLNSSSTDKHSYQTNKDGYENKIRSSIEYYLGQIAQDQTKVKFSSDSGHTICSVEMAQSTSVIWYFGNEAYKRMGNRTSRLKGDAIEKLVLDKMGLDRPAKAFVEPIKLESEDDIIAKEAEITTDCNNTIDKAEVPVKLRSIGDLRQGKGSFYMNLFSTGEWSWSKDVPADSDLEYCIPINCPASKHDLIMVYADGCVNRVDAYHLHLNRKQECKRYANGRRDDDVKLVKVFAATSEDLLACFSTQDGHNFVKVHPVSHVSQHENMSLMGNRMINTSGLSGITKADICFVSSEHTLRVSALQKTENQTSTSLGFQMDHKKNDKLRTVVDTLKALCDIPGLEA